MTIHTAPVRRYQTQEEANAYWAGRDYKKFVISFSTGYGRYAKRLDVNVGASTANVARQVGLNAAALMGHRWCKQATATVRLATAQDLGCVPVIRQESV